jgi:hypothetical protein
VNCCPDDKDAVGLHLDAAAETFFQCPFEGIRRASTVMPPRQSKGREGACGGVLEILCRLYLLDEEGIIVIHEVFSAKMLAVVVTL